MSFWWLVMVVVMMFPMVLGPVHTTAVRSLWRRRHRAIAVFLVGHVAPWMLFGVAAVAAAAQLRTHLAVEPWVLPAVAFCAALLWQITPVKRRAVMACHRLCLSPRPAGAQTGTA